jgi:hypothetical protein
MIPDGLLIDGPWSRHGSLQKPSLSGQPMTQHVYRKRVKAYWRASTDFESAVQGSGFGRPWLAGLGPLSAAPDIPQSAHSRLLVSAPHKDAQCEDAYYDGRR